jgi:hypothetical protein
MTITRGRGDPSPKLDSASAAATTAIPLNSLPPEDARRWFLNYAQKHIRGTIVLSIRENYSFFPLKPIAAAVSSPFL